MLGVRGLWELEEAGGARHRSAFPELRAPKLVVARAPGGGAWFRDPTVGVSERRGAGLRLKLDGSSFQSPEESGSPGAGAAQSADFGGGVVIVYISLPK